MNTLFKSLKLTLLFCIGLQFILSAQPQTPHQTYGKLFEAIQMQQIYPDGKTFVDCVPKEDPKQIMMLYNASDTAGFDLKAFANAHFYLPKINSTDYHSDTSATVQQHIHQLWDVLKRNPDDNLSNSSLLPLPNTYIVPGGRFREVYYWDSYFTMLGLQVDGKVDMMENMVKNFAFLIDKYGFIPNGNRSYYLTRSQPPFFSLMVDLLAKEKGDIVYKTYQSALLKEYNFWMQSGKSNAGSAVKMPDGSTLNRYWDMGNSPREESWREDVTAANEIKNSKELFYKNIRSGAASGWDFSSRWFKDGAHISTIQTTNIIAVDLNCLLYHLEQTLAKSYNVTNDKKTAATFNNKSIRRKAAILKYCWNQQQQFFTDYLIDEQKPSPEMTLAGMSPLFFKVANADQAKRTSRVIQEKFVRPGGVVTTLHKTGQQWDAPNGWAPLEYMTIKGLENYEQKELAKTIANRWIDLNIKVYKATGKLMEKYNVEDTYLIGGGGEYPLQDGFGWTNGVLLRLMKDYPQQKMDLKQPQKKL